MKKIFIILMLLPMAAFCQKTDTTYVLSPVPATDPHNVLAEEFSGQSCANCPEGSALLNSISYANPRRLNIVTLYTGGEPQEIPPYGSTHDFRNIAAANIASSVFPGLSALPTAGIDRINDGETFYMASVSGEITTRLSIADSLNLSVSGYYDVATNKVTVSAMVTYTKTMSSTQNISIVIVEDSIIDRQEDGITLDTNYQFNNVFRSMITSVPYGDIILPGMTTKEPGQVYLCTYTFSPDTSWIMNHCRVIAFVNGSSSAMPVVQQSAQNNISGNATAGVKAVKPAIFNVYPNPVTDVVNAECSISSDYKLLSITGSVLKSGAIKAGINTISMDAFPTGIYLLQLINNESVTVHKIVKE